MPDALLGSVMKMNEITQANGDLHVLCLEIFKGPFHRSVGIARLSVLLKQVEVAIMCVCKNTYFHNVHLETANFKTSSASEEFTFPSPFQSALISKLPESVVNPTA